MTKSWRTYKLRSGGVAVAVAALSMALLFAMATTTRADGGKPEESAPRVVSGSARLTVIRDEAGRIGLQVELPTLGPDSVPAEAIIEWKGEQHAFSAFRD